MLRRGPSRRATGRVPGGNARVPDIDRLYTWAFELVRAGGHVDIHADVAALIEQHASGLLGVFEDLAAMPLETSDVSTRGLRVCIHGRGVDRSIAITVDDQPYPDAFPSLQFLGQQRAAKVTVQQSTAGTDPAFAAALHSAFPGYIALQDGG